MYAAIIAIHIVTCIMLVLTVLIQQGKGAEIGAVFGSSEAMFGSAGPASFISKLTTGFAVVFMITSLSLTYLSAHRGTESIMQDVKVTTEAPVNEPVPVSGPGVEHKIPPSMPAKPVSTQTQEAGKLPEQPAPATKEGPVKSE